MSRRRGADALRRRPALAAGALPGLLTELRLAALAAAVAVVASGLAIVLGPVVLVLPVAAAVAYALVRNPPVLLALFVFVPYFESAPGIARSRSTRPSRSRSC